MRIVAGQYRSRLLKSPKGLELRPTSDYLRETLFNVLAPDVASSHFLDIFAGTGAVGIEALSRGAASVTFIESHRRTVALIKVNLAGLQITAGATVIASDALHALESLAVRKPAPQFDYLFLDPPYAAANDYDRVLAFLGSQNAENSRGNRPALLKPSTTVIAEHRRAFSLPPRFGALQQVRTITHGDASLSFFRVR